jgi:hypothetical protein
LFITTKAKAQIKTKIKDGPGECMYLPTTAIPFMAILGETPKLFVNSMPRQRNSTLAISPSGNVPTHLLLY